MAPSLLLSLREGLEAALIIGILLGTLKKIDRLEYRPIVWAGTFSAIALSLIAGIGIYALGTSFEGQAEEVFEGITMLLAAGVLTWVILWMHHQSQTIDQQLETDVRLAVFKGSRKALFALAFLAVIREGIELALILTAASFTADRLQILFGAGLGLGLAVLLAWLLFNSLVRLDLQKFFRVTSILLVLFAAGLVAHGVHELNEAGWIPSVVEHVWDINPVLNEKSFTGEILKTLFGYNGNPSLTELIAYVGYYLLLASSFRWQENRLRVAAAA